MDWVVEDDGASLVAPLMDTLCVKKLSWKTMMWIPVLFLSNQNRTHAMCHISDLLLVGSWLAS